MSKIHNPRIYCVYVHENQINGKVYVGMTSSPKNRFKGNGGEYHNNKFFTEDIKLYGWDNFSHEILYDDLTFDEAEYLERFLISYYCSTDRRFGYNIRPGGCSRNERVSIELLVK